MLQSFQVEANCRDRLFCGQVGLSVKRVWTEINVHFERYFCYKFRINEKKKNEVFGNVCGQSSSRIFLEAGIQ